MHYSFFVLNDHTNTIDIISSGPSNSLVDATGNLHLGFAAKFLAMCSDTEEEGLIRYFCTKYPNHQLRKYDLMGNIVQ
jgi:hypothetical protein